MMSRKRRYDLALFIALMSTAIAMAGSLAHLFALPNKIGMDRDSYFIAQSIYRGWSQFAYVLVVQLFSIIAVLAFSWRERKVRSLGLVALLGLVAAQAAFWTFTYPANFATDNWLRVPPDWQTLRRQWEYSHAAGAIFQTVAMASLVLASLVRK
jgi:hypothetical protein